MLQLLSTVAGISAIAAAPALSSAGAPVATSAVPTSPSPWSAGTAIPVSTGVAFGQAASIAYPGPVSSDAVVDTPYAPAKRTGLPRTRVTAIKADGTSGRSTLLPWSTVAPPSFGLQGDGLVVGSLGAAPSGFGGDLRYARVGIDGAVGAVQVLSAHAYNPQFAMDRSGNAVIVWLQPAAGPPGQLGPRFSVRAALRRRDGSFGAPATLLRTGDAGYESEGLTAAIGNTGHAVVAFTDNVSASVGSKGRVVRAWTGSVRGGFGAPITLGPHLGSANMAAAITSTGRAVIAWGTYGHGEEADTPYVVRVTSIAAGSRVHRAIRTLDPGEGRAFPVSGLRLVAPLKGGTATLAWSGVGASGRAFPVRSAAMNPSGRFSRPQLIAASGALAGLAVRRDGAAVLTYGRFDGDNADSGSASQSLAAVRAAGAAAFGDGEPLPVQFPGDTPAPTFSPSGHPVVAYTSPGVAAGGQNGLTILTRSAP